MIALSSRSSIPTTYRLLTAYLPPAYRLLTAYLPPTYRLPPPIDLHLIYFPQVIALVAQLDDVQRLRVHADESLRGVQRLVTTLQAENELLRQQTEHRHRQ